MDESESAMEITLTKPAARIIIDDLLNSLGIDQTDQETINWILSQYEKQA